MQTHAVPETIVGFLLRKLSNVVGEGGCLTTSSHMLRVVCTYCEVHSKSDYPICRPLHNPPNCDQETFCTVLSEYPLVNVSKGSFGVYQEQKCIVAVLPSSIVHRSNSSNLLELIETFVGIFHVYGVPLRVFAFWALLFHCFSAHFLGIFTIATTWTVIAMHEWTWRYFIFAPLTLIHTHPQEPFTAPVRLASMAAFDSLATRRPMREVRRGTAFAVFRDCLTNAGIVIWTRVHLPIFKTRQQQLLLICFVIPVALKANTKPKS